MCSSIAGAARHSMNPICICQLVFGCRLVECIALAQLPLSKPQRQQLHASIDENLRHPTASIQTAACSALAAFSNTYLPASDATATSEAVKRTSAKYLGLLIDPNVAVKRGAAAALGSLPPWLLEPLGIQVLEALAAATEVHTLTSTLCILCKYHH